MADYQKIDWQNGEEGGTPTSAANFRHMDDGIATAQSAADAAQRTADGKADPGDIPDVSDLATKDEIPTVPDVSGKADRSEIPDVSGFVTQSDIDSAVDGLASTSDIPDVSGLAPQSAVDDLEERLAALESAGTGE